LDLSYRAQMLGYHGRQVEDVAIETELPATMAAFRAQQKRWVRGGAQVLRSLLRRLGPQGHALPLRERLAMLAHLFRHARQPLLCLLLLWLPLTGPGLVPALPGSSIIWCAVLGLVHGA